MDVGTAIVRWIHEQTRNDPDHIWFCISSEEDAESLADKRYVDYGGQSFLVGLNPMDKRVGYAYDHEYKDRVRETLDELSLKSNDMDRTVLNGLSELLDKNEYTYK